MSGVHASDCAIHNAPAYAAGACDCGANEPSGFVEAAAPPIPVAGLAEGWPSSEEMHLLHEIRSAAEAKGRVLGLRYVGGGSGLGGVETHALVKSAALVRRRAAEAALFLKADGE